MWSCRSNINAVYFKAALHKLTEVVTTEHLIILPQEKLESCIYLLLALVNTKISAYL